MKFSSLLSIKFLLGLFVIFLSLLFITCKQSGTADVTHTAVQQIHLSKSINELIHDTSKITPLIDSLRKEFDIAEQNAQINLLGELAENWRPHTLEIAAEQYGQSLKLNYKFGIASSHCKNAIFYIRNFNLDSANHYLDAAEIMSEEINSKNILAEAISWRAELNRITGQNEKAIELQTKAINIAKSINDIKRLTFSNISKGEAHRIIGEFDNAIGCYEAAIAYAKQLNDENKISICYNSLGDVYRTINNFPKSLEYFNEGLELARKNNNNNQIAFCLSGIGDIYIDQNEPERSLEYYKEAYKYAVISGVKIQQCNSLSGLGLVYNVLGQDELAIENFNKAIEIAEEIGYYDKIAFCYTVIGEIYFSNNKHKEALESYTKALDIAKETNNIGLLLSSYYLISEYHFKQKNYTESEKYAMIGLKLSEENEILNRIKENARILAEIYELKNNSVKALKMFQLFIQMKDSVNNEETVKRMAAVEYQAKEKGLKSEQQAKEMTFKAEQSKKEAELQKQKAIRYAFTAGFVLVLLLVGIVFRNLQQNKRKNKIIVAQKKEVEAQKEIVDLKNKEITDSITYAKRLQEAILPPLKFVQQEFPESFILYKPKDIIAGDFYWMEKIDDVIFIAAADSTGHGVPGAMVSVVCSNALNRSIKEFKLTEPGLILDKARELVLETFEKSEGEVKDGMDISLLALKANSDGYTIKWSGANNPLYFINSNGLNEIKADKQPIGKTENPKPFTTHNVASEKNTVFYLITDGFADQFGGPKGKKFKSKNLQEYLISNSSKSLSEQNVILSEAFETWRGVLEQVDDVTIIGIKI